MLTRTRTGEYVTLIWDQDGVPSAHYVAGHVTEAEFRAELARRRQPTPPDDAKIEHVYVCNVRVGNDDWGNRTYEVRHCAAGARGAQPRTYWEIVEHRGTGAC